MSIRLSFRWQIAALFINAACSQEAARTPASPVTAPAATQPAAPRGPARSPPSYPSAGYYADRRGAPSSTTPKPYDLSQPLDTAALRTCQLQPADDSQQDASLQAYLAKLNRIVAAQDAQALLALVDTNTISSYGGGEYGRHDFAKTWQLHRGAASPIWAKLRRILRLGGVFTQGDEGREFRLPYAQDTYRISCQLDDTDPYHMAVCLQPATAVHRLASAESAVRARLPYSVVNVDDEQDAGHSWGELYCPTELNSSCAAWVRVSDLQGHPLGYVRTADLVFSVDYTLILMPKAPGRWRMAAYAPFD